MTYTSLTEALQDDRSWPDEPERKPRTPTPPRQRGFTVDETIAAVAIKLKELRREIAAADKATIEACMAAVGEVIVEQRKAMRAEFELELLKLRNEFLQQQLDAERMRKLKIVPSSGSGSMIA
jgi:hypothetical protein